MYSKILKAYGLSWRSFALFTLPLWAMVLGCTAAKKRGGEPSIPETDQISERPMGRDGAAAGTSTEDFGFDDHFGIRIASGDITPQPLESIDSLAQTIKTDVQGDITSLDGSDIESGAPDHAEIKSAVADKIVENYVNSKNKEPGGHCLTVSKRRFEKAYEDVYGHSVYDDLPPSMATAYYTPREVFDYLYVSASGIHNGWQSLPEEYRGKGNAGAIAYAGMGTLVDWFGIWTGKLRPGAPMQVWKHRKDYEKVVRGVSNKNFDPFGHSFIFMGYERNEKNEIIGIRIADQGYQSYRPLLHNDYEVWWAVNLNI